ncbi:MAG: hypothetical protein ACYC3X_01345 [Pirellulaceae bacterium]
MLNRRDMLKVSLAGAAGAVSPPIPASAAQLPNTSPMQATIGTRLFWTWDHSTEWVLNAAGAQTYGASNLYGRTTEMFIADYARLLRWCGRHAVDAVVVWGLLRDSHGGIDAAKRLCDVAHAEGVRLLAGVGLNAYGGVYYEGNSPYCLRNHLTDHPELYGLNPAGERMVFNFGVSGPNASHHACPSQKANQEYVGESLRWLFTTLPQLGGVQMETGDTGVCQCPLCRDRRQHPVSGFSWEDMAMMYPLAVEAIRSVAPTSWIICETYSHPEPVKNPDQAPGFGEGFPPWADACLSQFPADVLVQWVCDNFIAPKPKRDWTAAGRVSRARFRHVMRAHMSTYWGRYRGELAVDWISDMVQRSVAAGFDALSIFGEVSPFHTGAELNYLALAHYGSVANPAADLDVFLREVAGPLLGNEASAYEYLQCARLLDEREKIPDAIRRISARLPGLPLDAARRWLWLANYLSSFLVPLTTGDS